MALGDSIRVEVVWASPSEQRVLRLELPRGATVGEALAASGLPVSSGAAGTCALVMLGRRVDRTKFLADGDRLEILRPLLADPKSARFARVVRRKVRSAGT